MEIVNPWQLLRGGNSEQERGLRLVEQSYLGEPSPSRAMELGVALLWLGRYLDAWEHFRSVIRKDSRSGDNDYGMAGVAKWCLDKPDEAVFEWRAGLNVKYARAAGLGVRMPLLLFFAAVMKPDVFDVDLARRLLREKTGDVRIRNWPAPIAQLVVDKVSQGDFEKTHQGRNQRDTDNRIWLKTFYEGVLAYEAGQREAFAPLVSKLTDTDQPEWQDRDVFLTRIWHEEFFLARHFSIV